MFDADEGEWASEWEANPANCWDSRAFPTGLSSPPFPIGTGEMVLPGVSSKRKSAVLGTCEQFRFVCFFLNGHISFPRLGK